MLLAAERPHVAARCGTASLDEGGARHLDLSRRQTEERLRVVKALAELPALEQALASGQLHFSHVRELSRVATAETECAWIDWATGRRAVATLEPAPRPPMPAIPRARPTA